MEEVIYTSYFNPEPKIALLNWREVYLLTPEPGSYCPKCTGESWPPGQGIGKVYEFKAPGVPIGNSGRRGDEAWGTTGKGDLRAGFLPH